jgi:uncharacterized membrane protein YphA (DoxX/SURF4 family)
MVREKAMNVILWIFQALLAAAFLAAGGMKVSRPIEQLATSMHWVKSVSPGLVRALGAAEALGAIGVILPEVTHMLTWLTPLAAAGLAVVMVGATVFHLNRREASVVPMNLLLLILALVVAYGRVAVVPA